MSNVQRNQNLKLVVQSVRAEFEALAKIHGAVKWEREASFACQILEDNSFLESVARGNPDSLKRAIINVAGCGLSLSPVHKLAYLVPRGGKVCLDISYQGMVHSAIEAKAIKYAVAELVYEKDEFIFNGVGREPTHRYKAFTDRGLGVGVYCQAKTWGDEFIVTLMSTEEVFRIRDRSESWKSFQAGKAKQTPWDTDPGEMVKKTCIRRAFKSWPKGDTGDDRLKRVIEITDDADPVEFLPLPVEDDTFQLTMGRLRTALTVLEKTEEAYLGHLVRVTGRELKKLEDLTQIEADQAGIFLDQLIDKKRKKEAEAREVSFENAG